ncbi:hypothetical protein RND81_02G154600 [Saponaria officinalis]|uniref:Cyclin-like domain-containing protein n=1 Tax=Saponaria officinalis TaxID=3572 RepID=A0AAW1MN27_SAPOF
MKCPYCSSTPTRCTTTASRRCITTCTTCDRIIWEHQTQTHHLFHLRAEDSPLLLSTSDLPPQPPSTVASSADDPFTDVGFITAFSAVSLDYTPVYAASSLSFSGHLADLERTLESSSSGVVVDNLRAYLQIIDVASILGLDRDISDHAFQLFRDCSSATCLRNRSVEALSTACLVQAIREAQQPRTLQEISIAANLPQKEIGKYIKILGEALQLSQPINSNSIAVHMPRFCNLLQLNKSAQELATHIGEVVMNKCFCTRRNPISISAAAIYLACQLEDRRKTQAEICKVTGLTEVTLRKVYKELLENWDDLLPSNYTPVVPPEKAFPTTTIASGRSTTPRGEPHEIPNSELTKTNQAQELLHQDKGKAETDGNPPITNKILPSWKPGVPFGTSVGRTSSENQNVNQGVSQAQEVLHHDKGKSESDSTLPITNKILPSWKPGVPFGTSVGKTSSENQTVNQGVNLKFNASMQEADQKGVGSVKSNPFAAAQVLGPTSTTRPPPSSSSSPYTSLSQSGQYQAAGSSELEKNGRHNGGRGPEATKGK